SAHNAIVGIAKRRPGNIGDDSIEHPPTQQEHEWDAQVDIKPVSQSVHNDCNDNMPRRRSLKRRVSNKTPPAYDSRSGATSTGLRRNGAAGCQDSQTWV